MASESEIVQTTLDGLLREGESKAPKDESDEKGIHTIPAASSETQIGPRGFLRSFPRCQELYEQGLSDVAIAREVGVSRSAIFYWRKQRNLPPNFPRHRPPKLSPEASARRQELYEQGLSDVAIAREVGTGALQIWRWRKQQNLPPNHHPPKPVAIESDLVKEYLEDCELSLSPRTVQTRKSCLGMYERFLKSRGKTIEETILKPDFPHQGQRLRLTLLSLSKDVRDFLNNLKKEDRTRGTILIKLSAIKSFYQFVESNGFYVPDLRGLKTKEYRHEKWEGAGREPLSRDEVRRLIEAPDSLRDTLLLALLYYSALRAGEAASLKIEKVDTTRRILGVMGKGNKPGPVPYPSKLDWLIDRYIKKERRSYTNSESSDYFFVSKSGSKLSVQQIYRITCRAAEKARIQKVVEKKPDGTVIYKVKPHVLRHSFVAHAREDGMPEEHIQRILRHRRRETTMGYGKESVEAVFKSYHKNFKGI